MAEIIVQLKKIILNRNGFVNVYSKTIFPRKTLTFTSLILGAPY